MEKGYTSFQRNTFLHCFKSYLKRQRHDRNRRREPYISATSASNYSFFTTQRVIRRNAYRALPYYALPLGPTRFSLCNKDKIGHEITEALPELTGGYHYTACFGTK